MCELQGVLMRLLPFLIGKAASEAREMAPVLRLLTHMCTFCMVCVLLIDWSIALANKGRQCWQKIPQLCCDDAGIRCTTLETERQGHARDVVLALSLAELQSYDGIVAVSLQTFQDNRLNRHDNPALASLQLCCELLFLDVPQHVP